MPASVPRYWREFNEEAIKQVTQRGHSVADVGARLGASSHNDYKMNHRRITAVFLGSAVVLVAVVLLRQRTPPLQQSIDCVDAKTCLPSYRNTLLCEALPVGTTERELIYRLGQPTRTANSVLYFAAGATEKGPIEVELDARRNAQRISCHGGSN